MTSVMLALSPFLLLFVGGAIARSDLDDFMSLVTLPDVWVVNFEVIYHDRTRVSPGYWFVAPYGKIEYLKSGPQPFQVGPYIYDEDGVLIWVGSRLFNNANVYDFKAVHHIDDNPYLSFIVHENDGHSKGRGIVMNHSYEVESEVQALEDLAQFDLHEFNILPGGKTALTCGYQPAQLSLADLGRSQEQSFFLSVGFYEVEIATGEVVMRWNASAPGNVAMHESVKLLANTEPEEAPGNDYLHINSVDKNADGNYLISIRFTNTIYLISGADGSILWRLGGRESDFDQDFTFSKQHDAKFIESGGTRHVISFLNNAADHEENEEDVSSALIVELNTGSTPMTAKVIRRYDRPDGQLTRLRGNVQPLPNGNVFVGWSDSGYHSEFSPEGANLMEAKFVNSQLSTYRAYKFEFVGRPTAPPDLVVSVAEITEDNLTTVIHISWNGATEVASWNFYAQAGEREPRRFVGTTNKTGFETMHTIQGYLDWISADATDRDGNILGSSAVGRTTVPTDWMAFQFNKSNQGVPADPSGPLSSIVADPTTENNDQVVEVLGESIDTFHTLGGLLLLILVLGSSGAILVGGYWMVTKRRIKTYRHIYQHIPLDDSEETELPTVISAR
ncbi:hypothetical protein N7510_008186 [Penicillium lagena]|uniref:uncharacterized protein n=1 Tax=Penicillium lagena TaxID=94218 RepID=UPI0025408BEC|nr:uncharacterized protein N7510_008186 [Penicillium lagena]KAJ5605405.1 hypothetical protein N7510_008186 [Penicillium lagena]